VVSGLDYDSPISGSKGVPQSGPGWRRATRAALLLDWLATEGDPRSSFVVWGQLHAQLRAGLRVQAYTEQEMRLALGLV
jgi:hypothetical protein